MPYRLPVNSRRFHGDMRAVFGRQPFRQCHEILGRRLERADLSLSRAIHHMAHAGHHCILVNIKTGTMPMQNFHRFSLNAAGLEPPLSKSRTRAPGLSPARDTIWGAQGFRVRLTDGLARTKINTGLCVDGTTAAYPRLPPVSYPAGRGLRWGANGCCSISSRIHKVFLKAAWYDWPLGVVIRPIRSAIPGRKANCVLSEF